MKLLGGAAVVLVVFLALASCQTAKPVAAPAAQPAAAPAAAPAAQPAAAPAAPGTATEKSVIQTDASGFSPTAENGRTAIDFALLFGNKASVKAWKVQIAADGNVRKTFSGNGSNLAEKLSWDGKGDSGALAPQGKYTASLIIDYGAVYKAATVSSTPFALDIVPPSGTITLSPALFSPIEPTDTLTIGLSATSSIAKIDSWSLDIYDPGGNLFKSFDGKWPDNKVVWDGKGISGDTVVSAEDYPVLVKLRDEYGNVGQVKGSIPIDVLVLKETRGYRIPNSRVFFKEFTADYADVPADLAKQNKDRLNELADKLKKFPDYKIKIVGHAVMIHWDNSELGKIEEEEVLVPLSKARAEAIKQAMVDRGLKAEMITTEGVGASDQLVPDSDYPNRWRNRRTAIFLDK